MDFLNLPTRPHHFDRLNDHPAYFQPDECFASSKFPVLEFGRGRDGVKTRQKAFQAMQSQPLTGHMAALLLRRFSD